MKTPDKRKRIAEKKRIRRKNPPTINKNVLADEYIRNADQYATKAELWRKYYAPKTGRKVTARPTLEFYKLVKGIEETREKEIRVRRERQMKKEADLQAKKNVKSRQESSFLDPQEYVQTFLQLKAILGEKLSQILKEINELRLEHQEKMIKWENGGRIGRPPVIGKRKHRIGREERDTLHLMGKFWAWARSAYKMPEKYTVTTEDKDTQESIGDLLRMLDEYETATGDQIIGDEHKRGNDKEQAKARAKVVFKKPG